MNRHLNTIYVTSPGAYISKDGECLRIALTDNKTAKIPVLGIESVVCIGRVTYSAEALAHCATNGVSLSHLSETGRFLARLEGPVSGNVLVRKSQFKAADNESLCSSIIQNILTGKIANTRHVLSRAAREDATSNHKDQLSNAISQLDSVLAHIRKETSIDTLRGHEGEAANIYWRHFPLLLATSNHGMVFSGRSRRPPLDPVNALLSFLYTLLTHDVRSAIESCGLDPQVGFLHRDRPGRPSLALDMMEEFRPVIADRLALTLINRQQIKSSDFQCLDNGAVLLKEDARKSVIQAWQERKREEREHSFTKETIKIGLFWHLQALLLKRHLRGDLDGYPPCLWR